MYRKWTLVTEWIPKPLYYMSVVCLLLRSLIIESPFCTHKCHCWYRYISFYIRKYTNSTFKKSITLTSEKIQNILLPSSFSCVLERQQVWLWATVRLFICVSWRNYQQDNCFQRHWLEVAFRCEYHGSTHKKMACQNSLYMYVHIFNFKRL